MYLLLLLFILVTTTYSLRTQRFTVGDDTYSPKLWKLIPRTKAVHSKFLQPPQGAGSSPDDFFKFIPSYVGSVLPGKPISWSSPCFQSNTASLTVNGNKSARMTITTSNKSSWFCDDTYLFGYVGSFDITFFEVGFWNHHVDWAGGWNDAEMYDLNTHGIRVFRFPDGLTATAQEIFETVMLFFGALIGTHVPEWTAEDNLLFLKNHMNYEMPPRQITNVNIPKSEIKSGDFFGVMRLDGLDPMLAWGMGARIGHTVISLWIDNELYMCESTAKSNYWPVDGIQKTPYDQWIEIADKADFNVVHLPLSPEIAKRFNTTAATEFLNSVIGLPYGFHNLFTGWVDTAEDNYPPPLSSKLVMLLAPFGEWLTQQQLKLGETYDFIAQGLNHRLGTTNLSMQESFMESHKRGMSFTDLVTMPEQDSWIFKNGPGFRDGPSMVCDVFVTRMWKAGGIFGDLTDKFQATEFTDWDAYVLNIFDRNYQRPKQCVEADPDSPFCQILGKYRISIPDYNTADPYPNMRERCPTLPPDYKKPPHC